MQIILDTHNNRVLIKDNGERVNINNGDIIEYTGIYYKTINDIVTMVEIRTSFIGSVEHARINEDNAIEGIYIKPLYIRDQIRNEWNKIAPVNLPLFFTLAKRLPKNKWKNRKKFL